ncbi:UNVERIFIED_CONTAM: hypothetical protein Sradi_3346600 [Sesamum radiatum]|uniref:DNA/RNA-binding protein Alba-like domain-containing protein n=1 Tax=Sesamum radiatum TaxID=300843 RepID=A0AAW2R3A8_SESRA
MEEITDGVTNISISGDSQKKNRIQVSNTKKPLFFYVNLAKRYMQQHNEVELSALGMGICRLLTYHYFFFPSSPTYLLYASISYVVGLRLSIPISGASYFSISVFISFYWGLVD